MQSQTRWIAAVLTVAIAALLQSAESHKVGFGRCDPVEHMQGFDPDRFEGVWYVIEIFSTTSKCMTMTFNRTTSGFDVTEGREFYLGRMVNLDHTFKNTGTFTITNPSDPAKMKASWPSNFLGNANVMVVDTDYDNFAVLFECQSLVVINRHSAVILSRSNTLDASVIQTVKDDMAAFGVDVTDFDIMDHRSCSVPGQADFNWEIDEDTFKTGGGGGGGAQAGLNFPENIEEVDSELINSDPSFNEVY